MTVFKTKNFPEFMQAFFVDYLMNQKRASQHTIASYRDTFRLLLQYAKSHLKKKPSKFTIDDLDAAFIVTFLTHLEKERAISPSSRNQRLAAIRAFFHYVALQLPEKSLLIQRVLAIPNKRCERVLITFLTRPEIESILNAPDRKTRMGCRDHALLKMAIQTGLRVSELTLLRCEDVVLGASAYVHCFGKGRKERCTPLTKKTVKALRTWLQYLKGKPSDWLFPNARGGQMSTDGVQYLLNKYVVIAQNKCPSLKRKRVSPHVLRHTTAMQLLHAGVDRGVIALWLGHESVETTQIYLDANLKMKEEILEKTTPYNTKPGRYRADDKLMEFLNTL